MQHTHCAHFVLMRYTIVTETYPPEVNGVALTVEPDGSCRAQARCPDAGSASVILG